MAELNFNALIPQGPRGFYQGFEQGQERSVKSEMDQLKLEEIKRDRDEMLQLREQLKSLGQDADPVKFLDTLAKTGNPEYVKMAIEGKQKIKDLEAYAKLGVIEPIAAAPAMPTAAPASVVRMPQAPAPTNALGSGTFGMPELAAPANALAARAPVAPVAQAPANALAPQPGADQAAQAQRRIEQLLTLARTNPRVAGQAMAEARILQDQLELFSKRGPVKPAALQELEAYMLMTPEQKATYEKLQKIKAPGTTVNLPPQEKAFESGLGAGQSKRILDSVAAAEDAAQILQTNQVGRDILKSGAITGAGANFFVGLNNALKQGGIDFGYADAAANSQAYGAAMAQNVGKLIKQYGAGTGLSDADRNYATKAAGGEIAMDEKAIRKILDINDRAANYVIDKHNKNVQGIKTNVPLTVEKPAAPQKVPAAAANQIPGQRAATPAMNIPQAAIDALRAGKGTDAQFDEIFGAGAAKRARGGK